jgi:DCN1-like protein 1/2
LTYRDVNNAVEEYFSKGYGESAKVTKGGATTANLQKSFNLYKDASSGRIEGEGIQKFFADLGVDPMDPVTLLISMYMKASTMGFYTYEEYECGMKSLNSNTASELKK